MNVEQGWFTPLVFSANGGMGRECKTFYSALAEMIAIQRKQENVLLHQNALVMMKSFLFTNDIDFVMYMWYVVVMVRI